MNIFYVDRDPVRAARALCDKHIVKMPSESAIMLRSYLDPTKRGWANHPCTVWTGASAAHWLWHVQHGLALCAEYTRRYGRIHASEAVIAACREHGSPSTEWAWTDPPRAMPPEIAALAPDDTVEAYRHYYRIAKSRFAQWKHTTPPSWFMEAS